MAEGAPHSSILPFLSSLLRFDSGKPILMLHVARVGGVEDLGERCCNLHAVTLRPPLVHSDGHAAIDEIQGARTHIG